MTFKNSFRHLWRTFLHPRVFIFITIGTAIIFLTFLTTDNALEIAISGFASVFIGIGVNNFSSLGTHQKDEQKLKSAIGHSLKIMEMANAKIEKIQNEINSGDYKKVMEEFTELKQITILTMQFLKEEVSLD